MSPVIEGRWFRPDLLMIGATGRNAGKTELACQLIRRHAGAVPVAGLKVTTVERADGDCPRGGAGCGVCSSLADDWCLTREDDAGSTKDTSRLLASGARQVHWLRVLRSALWDGANELLATIAPGWVSVCESNSLRQVVEPGLFLQVRVAGSGSGKESARAVAHLADLVVVTDGRSFDLPLERISLVDGQWALRRDACALVLADGPGEPAAGDDLASVRRQVDSLRPQFDQILIGTRWPLRYEGLGLPVVVPGAPEDGREGDPLVALAAALPFTRHDWCFVVSAASPGVPAGLVNALFRRRSEVDAVVLGDPSGRRQSSVGLVHRRALAAVGAALAAGDHSLSALADHCALRTVAVDDYVAAPPGDDAASLAS